MEEDPEYQVSIFREGEHSAITDATLTRVIRETLRQHKVPSARISVALVDDAHIARLNEEHLRHCGPTDVLTFDLQDELTEAPGDVCQVDGELVISAETAARQAAERGHGVEAEAALYAVHGALHLLGYDDGIREDANRMHKVEDEILSSLGLGAVFESRTGRD
jgi:probable rRNA maturation factor